MSVTATGPVSLPAAGLAVLFAASATFQTETETASAEAALARVLYPKAYLIQRYDEEGDPIPLPVRSWIIITYDDLCTWEFSKQGVSAGSMVVTFQFKAHPDYDVHSDDAMTHFTNVAGAIISEVLALSNTEAPDQSQYWNAVKFTQLVAPALCDERKEEEKDVEGELFFEAAYLVDWM